MTPREYNILHRVWRWLRLFRHRCGYGVHSPFAFQLITDVIYNGEAYYAYDALRQPLEPSLVRCDEYDPESGLIAKDLRLLFRLVNSQQPTTIVLSGASPAVTAYLHAARRAAHIMHLPSASHRDEAASPQTAPPAVSPVFAYVDACRPAEADALQQLCAASTDAMVVVRGIHRDAAAQHSWQQLQQHPAVTLTFDLGRFGVAIRRDKMNRQHYVVNYF